MAINERYLQDSAEDLEQALWDDVRSFTEQARAHYAAGFVEKAIEAKVSEIGSLIKIAQTNSAIYSMLMGSCSTLSKLFYKNTEGIHINPKVSRAFCYVFREKYFPANIADSDVFPLAIAAAYGQTGFKEHADSFKKDAKAVETLDYLCRTIAGKAKDGRWPLDNGEIIEQARPYLRGLEADIREEIENKLGSLSLQKILKLGAEIRVPRYLKEAIEEFSHENTFYVRREVKHKIKKIGRMAKDVHDIKKLTGEKNKDLINVVYQVKLAELTLLEMLELELQKRHEGISPPYFDGLESYTTFSKILREMGMDNSLAMLLSFYNGIKAKDELTKNVSIPFNEVSLDWVGRNISYAMRRRKWPNREFLLQEVDKHFIDNDVQDLIRKKVEAFYTDECQSWFVADSMWHEFRRMVIPKGQ
jgi:hypothetical protein